MKRLVFRRKIQGGKFSEMLNGRFVIGFRGLNRRAEGTKIDMLSVWADSGFPLSIMRPDSFVRFGLRSFSAFIPTILTLSRFPQIASPVVQSVVIAMITSAAEDEPMHIGMIDRRCDGVPYFSACDCHPIPLREPFEIGGIHYGDFLMSQWDKAIFLVERLANRIAFCATLLGHVLTVNESVLPVAIISGEGL